MNFNDASFWIGLQVFIVLVETFIRLSVTSLETKKRCRGYLIGVCAQFLWLAIFVHTHMWYLMPLLVLDGGIWLRGYLKHRKKLWNSRLRIQNESNQVVHP